MTWESGIVWFARPVLRHDESLASNVERYQGCEVDHAVFSHRHIENRQERFRLGIVGELTAREVLFDTSAADHLAHCAILLFEVDGNDAALGFVPKEFAGATCGNFVDDSLGCEHWIT